MFELLNQQVLAWCENKIISKELFTGKINKINQSTFEHRVQDFMLNIRIREDYVIEQYPYFSDICSEVTEALKHELEPKQQEYLACLPSAFDEGTIRVVARNMKNLMYSCWNYDIASQNLVSEERRENTVLEDACSFLDLDIELEELNVDVTEFDRLIM